MEHLIRIINTADPDSREYKFARRVFAHQVVRTRMYRLLNTEPYPIQNALLPMVIPRKRKSFWLIVKDFYRMLLI